MTLLKDHVIEFCLYVQYVGNGLDYTITLYECQKGNVYNFIISLKQNDNGEQFIIASPSYNFQISSLSWYF